MRLGNEPDFLSKLGPKAKSEKKAQDYFTPKVKPKTNIAQTSSLKVAAEKLDIGKPARDANQSRIEGKAKSLTQTKQESEGTLEHFMEAWDMGKYGKATNGEIDDPEREQVRAEAFSLLKDGQRFDAGATALLKDRLNMAKSAGTYLKPGEIGQFKQETLTPEDPEKASEARQKRMREQVDGGVVDWATNDDATFFQDLRDEAEHRLGKFNQEHGVIAQIEKAVGIDPTTEPVNTWLSGAAGKLFATPLNIPAAVEFIGDTSKPMPDRVMATGGLLLDLLGLKLSAEAAVSRVRGSGVPRKAVEEVLATSGKNAPPDVRTRIDELLSEIRKDPPPVTREMEAVQEAELRGRVGASQVEAETSSPLPDDVPTNTQAGTQSGQPPIEPDLPEALRTVDQTAVPSSVELTPRRTIADTDADIETVRERIKSRARPLPGGRRAGVLNIGAEDIADQLTLGKLHFERGYRTFADWSRKMIADLGRSIQPQLPAMWKQIQDEPLDDAVNRVQAAIKEARPIRETEAVELAAGVRSKQAGALAAMQAKNAPLGKQLGSLKGGFANYSFQLPESFSPEDAAHLVEMVNKNDVLKPFQKVNAQVALEKITGKGGEVGYGVLPTDSELELLTRVFGPGFTGAIKAKALGLSFWDNLNQWRKGAGMLLNPRTIERNFVGNFIQAARTEGLRPVDAVFDQMIKLKTGQRTTSAFLPSSKESTRFVVQKTIQDIKDIAKHGTSGIQGAGNDYLPESQFGPIRAAMRFQNMQDVPWQNIAHERSIREQARLMAKGDKLAERGFIDNPTEAMEIQAQVDAAMATFAGENAMATALSNASRTNLAPLVELLFPFKRIPMNIAGDVATANPLGIIYNIKKFANVAKTGTPGEIAAAQKLLARKATDGTLGTFLLWYGSELYKQGRLKPAPGADKAKRDTATALDEPGGSFLIDGKAYSVGGVHPFLSAMLSGASMSAKFDENMAKQTQEDEPYEGKMLKPEWFEIDGEADPKLALVDAIANGMNQTIQEFPFFQGVKQLTDVTRGELAAEEYAYNVVATLAPTLYDTFARLFGQGDPAMRKPATPGEALLARFGLPDGAPKVDAFGRIVTKTGPFDMLNTRVVKTGAVEDLMRKHKLTVTTIPKLPHEKDPRNANRNAQYAARQVVVGSTLYNFLESQVDGLSKIKDPAMRKKMWETLVRDGREIGDMAYSKQVNGAGGVPPVAKGTIKQ